MTDENNRGEDGQPMLKFDSMNKNEESFDIDDRSDDNIQQAVSMLKREFGSNYKSAINNARAVLEGADEEYPKSLEQTGLGNYPPLIRELNKLGFKLSKKFEQADKPGSMRKAQLKALEKEAREKINHLISKIETDYIKEHGGINR